MTARVLSGWRMDKGSHMVALRLDLASGWKTYWRSPGEAGIPPQFDWSASQNIKSFTVHWPRPSVFKTNGMKTIGYHDQLVLPVEIVPRDPSKPMHLAARVDLGICRDICMPASVQVTADVEGRGARDPLIAAALVSRPKRASEAGLGAISCAVEPISDGLRLTAQIALPSQGGEETVAFESRDPSVWVSEAKVSRKGGALVAVAELVPPSGTPFALDRSGVTLTVLGTKGAVEIKGCPSG